MLREPVAGKAAVVDACEAAYPVVGVPDPTPVIGFAWYHPDMSVGALDAMSVHTIVPAFVTLEK